MQTFKEGDQVSYKESPQEVCYYVRGCSSNGIGAYIERSGDNGWVRDSDIPDSYISIAGDTYWSSYDGELTLVKPVAGQTLINQIQTNMTNIKDFVKTSLLSKEEKLLRKHGFKQAECGEYTEAAKQFAIEALCKQQEAEMLKVAEAMEAEKEASK